MATVPVRTWVPWYNLNGVYVEVIDRPHINATGEGLDHALALLVQAWNRETPGDPKTVDDFQAQ